MKKLALVATAIALMGCNATLRSARDTPSPRYALLTVVTEHPPNNPQWPYGIWTVDGQDIAPAQRLRVYVATGRRVIHHICPDFISVDASPSVTEHFVPGERYELVCHGQAQGYLRKVQSPGG